MELGSMEKVPWNSMELWIWTKFHGIPWNSKESQVFFKCCSKSSMELWRKFHGNFWSKQVSMSIKKRFWMIFWYVMSNAASAYGIMQILIIKHQSVKEIAKKYRVFINLRKLIHPAQLNMIFIKIWKLKSHGILSHFKAQCIYDTNGSIK